MPLPLLPSTRYLLIRFDWLTPVQYTFQLAFVNPLYDPIQIRLVPSTAKDPYTTTSIYVPVPHFTVNALKDAWAYDEDEEDEDHGGSEGASEGGSSTVSGTTRSGPGTGTGTLSKKSRLSMLGALAGAGGDKRSKRDHGVEKRGNMSKIGIEVEVLPDAPSESPIVVCPSFPLLSARHDASN